MAQTVKDRVVAIIAEQAVLDPSDIRPEATLESLSMIQRDCIAVKILEQAPLHIGTICPTSPHVTLLPVRSCFWITVTAILTLVST